MSNDQDRIASINLKASDHIRNWLIQYETGEMREDDLLAVVYAAMVTASALGYDVAGLVEETTAAAQRLLDMLDIDEDENNGWHSVANSV